jgi:hypothetical protein
MTPSDVIAMTAVISTAVVAVVGFGVQTSIAKRDRRRIRDDGRYAELARVYEEAGRVGTTAVGWLRRSTDPLALQRALDDPDIKAGSHALKRLQMFEADPTVIAAMQHFMDGLGPEGKAAARKTAKVGGVDDMADAVDARLKEYYIACGASLARFRASIK